MINVYCLLPTTIQGEMSTIFRHQLKERIYTIGSILRIMHNFLMMDTEAEATAKVRCCVRTCTHSLMRWYDLAGACMPPANCRIPTPHLHDAHAWLRV